MSEGLKRTANFNKQFALRNSNLCLFVNCIVLTLLSLGLLVLMLSAVLKANSGKISTHNMAASGLLMSVTLGQKYNSHVKSVITTSTRTKCFNYTQLRCFSNSVPTLPLCASSVDRASSSVSMCHRHWPTHRRWSSALIGRFSHQSF